MLRALGRIQADRTADRDLGRAAAELCAAAELDGFGREPYQILVFRMEGHIGGDTAHRTLLLHGTDTYEITAAVTALTTYRLLDGLVPAGLHHVEDVVPAPAMVEWLRTLRVVTTVGVVREPVELEEGVL